MSPSTRCTHCSGSVIGTMTSTRLSPSASASTPTSSSRSRWSPTMGHPDQPHRDPPDHPTAQDPEALALEKQADQEKRAKILQSEGQRQSAINVADGDAQAAVREAEGSREAAILRAEGNRQAAILEAEGRSQAITTVYSAIKKGEPDRRSWQSSSSTRCKVRGERQRQDRRPVRERGAARGRETLRSVLAAVPGTATSRENPISAPSQGERGQRGRRHTRRTPWPSTCCSSTTEARRRP